MHKEGGKAVYAGDDLTIGQGSLGRVLAIAGEATHVQWLDGPRLGQVDLVPNYDLSASLQPETTHQVIAAQFDDALEMADPHTAMVREAYDTYGEDGVLAALDDAGQMAVLASYATEAMEHLARHLRDDAVLGELLASLEDYEREAVLSRLAGTLLDPEEEDEIP